MPFFLVLELGFKMFGPKVSQEGGARFFDTYKLGETVPYSSFLFSAPFLMEDLEVSSHRVPQRSVSVFKSLYLNGELFVFPFDTERRMAPHHVDILVACLTERGILNPEDKPSSFYDKRLEDLLRKMGDRVAGFWNYHNHETNTIIVKMENSLLEAQKDIADSSGFQLYDKNTWLSIKKIATSEFPFRTEFREPAPGDRAYSLSPFTKIPFMDMDE